MKLVIRKKAPAPTASKYLFDPSVQGISQSQIGTRMECEEKARLSTLLGWTPKGSSKPLIWGTTFHGMLGAGYRSLRATMTWPEESALITSSEAELKEEYPNPTTTVRDITEECFLETIPMIGPYRRKWASQDDKVKWLKVEDAFKVPVAPGLPPIKGKFDAVFEHPQVRGRPAGDQDEVPDLRQPHGVPPPRPAAGVVPDRLGEGWVEAQDRLVQHHPAAGPPPWEG